MGARILAIGEGSYKYGKRENQNQSLLRNSAVQNQSAKAAKMLQISDFVAEAPG